MPSCGRISPGALSTSLDLVAIAVGVFQERPNKRRNVVVVTRCETTTDGGNVEVKALDEGGLFLTPRDCFNVNLHCDARLPPAELARLEPLLHEFEKYDLLLIFIFTMFPILLCVGAPTKFGR